VRRLSDAGQWNLVRLLFFFLLLAPTDYDLDQASYMVLTHTRAKNQGHRSLGSKARVETNGRTDGLDRLPYSAR